MNEEALEKARNLVLARRKQWQASMSTSDWDAYMEAILDYGRLRGPEFMEIITDDTARD